MLKIPAIRNTKITIIFREIRQMPFYNWDEMKRKHLAAPSESEGSIIIGDFVTLNRSVSAPGKIARPHSHGCEQLIQVVEGEALFQVGEEERAVTAGDLIHIPLGCEHGFKNTGGREFIYLSFKNRSQDWPPATATMD
jgi:quercetin dioxygenase-like cupin family protein